MKRFLLFLVGGAVLLGAVCFCSLGIYYYQANINSEAAALPTAAAVAEVPTIAIPTPTLAPHTNLITMARQVIGDDLDKADIATHWDLGGKDYPDGRVGYYVELVLKSPEEVRREDVLFFGYRMAREFYYNSQGYDPMYISIHFHVTEENSILSNCNLWFGVGHAAVKEYLPENTPEDLEAWFSKLQDSRYYGDLPGEHDSLIAFANDGTRNQLCELDNWQRSR